MRCDAHGYATRDDPALLANEPQILMPANSSAHPRPSSGYPAQTAVKMRRLTGSFHQPACASELPTGGILWRQDAITSHMCASRAGPHAAVPSPRPVAVPSPFAVPSAAPCPIYDLKCDITALPADLDVTSEIGVQHSERNLRDRGHI